jgi:E3 ubiquitin-protein ligase RAD18
MKMERINGHLDTCVGGRSSVKSKNVLSFTDASPSVTTNPRIQRPHFEPTPLPTLNYSLLSDANLRKKLKDLGISSTGNRPVLERRHREWLTLWNANCDASNPRSKAELLRELDTWERIQVGQQTSRIHTLSSGGLPITSKEFDSAAWSSKHGPAYRSLIEEAGRNKRLNLTEGAASTSKPIAMANDVCGDGLDNGSKKCAH